MSILISLIKHWVYFLLLIKLDFLCLKIVSHINGKAKCAFDYKYVFEQD